MPCIRNKTGRKYERFKRTPKHSPTAISCGECARLYPGVGQGARAAARELRRADTGLKNRALEAMASRLTASRQLILEANALDLQRGKETGLDAALLDRLALNDARIDAMVEGLHQVAALPDPVGEIDDMRYRPSGIQVGKIRVPLGVIGIIYESRPNVTLEAASLCLKSGNHFLLRGGSEASASNAAIRSCIQEGLPMLACQLNPYRLLPPPIALR